MFKKLTGDKEDKSRRGGKATVAPPLKPFSRKGSHTPTKTGGAPPPSPETPQRTLEIPGSLRIPERRHGPGGDSKRLVIGRDICLSGEITSCDRLVVEGSVEVNISDARALEVAASGHFKGEAEVDQADISGRFEGNLTAREKLTVRAGGRVSGTIRYGSIVIESGGEISGDTKSLGNGDTPGETD